MNRYATAQRDRTLYFPSLLQPQDDNEETGTENGEQTTEMARTRSSYRFIIAADSQFGILMDGFDMGDDPNWNTEIDISRRVVQKINAMKDKERPLFVCVCGDLVDTEPSFEGNAHAAWKRTKPEWKRQDLFQQQMEDWKDCWSCLDDDIALVCLCGNHDVGNRPTAASIATWTLAFGDDYLAFWVNGTYHIGLNNCLFSDPSGAQHLFEEQLQWLKERLEYASSKGALQIFVYSHFPWFIQHEDETNEDFTSTTKPPEGWGPPGAQWPDYYFSIPLESRQMALSLFRKHGVKACFSGHFHQNVVTKTSWGMHMIVTGPMSMLLKSSIQSSLSSETQTIGMRVVDVDEHDFKHEFIPLDENCN